MKICSVPSCKRNALERPDLKFFNLPRQGAIRDEWLEVLSVSGKEHSRGLCICELHFKEKDFKAGTKRELKVHAVPVLRLRSGKTDVESDDEFMNYGSDNELNVEMAEIETKLPEKKPKTVSFKEVSNQEPEIEAVKTECETFRRPSRRAALVAAKKIFNTSRNFGITEGIDNSPPVSSPKTPGTRTKKLKINGEEQSSIQTPETPTKKKIIVEYDSAVEVDLRMECCEEILSPIQAKFMSEAQNHYNYVMKDLRELAAAKVKIIEIGPVDPADALLPPIKNMILGTPKNTKASKDNIQKGIPIILL